MYETGAVTIILNVLEVLRDLFLYLMEIVDDTVHSVGATKIGHRVN